MSRLIWTGSLSLPCGSEVFKINVLLTPSAAIRHPRADDSGAECVSFHTLFLSIYFCKAAVILFF